MTEPKDITDVGGLGGGVLAPMNLPPREATPEASVLARLRGLAFAVGDAELDTRPPDREWLIDQVLPLGKVGILAAGGGVGKTRALVELALSVATGSTWYGFGTRNEGRVLLALGEEDAAEAHRRIYFAARDRNFTPAERAALPGRITVLPLAGVPASFVESRNGAFVETDALQAFRSLLDDGMGGWSLIVLDPLSRFAGGDTETDNHAATRFVQAVESLATATGATVLMAHHTTKTSRTEGKTGATGIRGASAIHDGVRWAATLDPIAETDVVLLDFVKSNYSKRPGLVPLLMGEHGVLRRIAPDEYARILADRDKRAEERKAQSKGSTKKPETGKPAPTNDSESLSEDFF
jgi:hypothetical protein